MVFSVSGWIKGALGALALGLLVGCNNSPHPAGAERENALYMAFRERSPRYLDPTSSYTAPESTFTMPLTIFENQKQLRTKWERRRAGSPPKSKRSDQGRSQ